MIAVAEISYISKNNTIVVNNIHKIQSETFMLGVATTRRNAASNTRRCNDVSVTRSGNTAIPDTGTVYSSVRHPGPPILLPVFCVHLVATTTTTTDCTAKKEIYIYIHRTIKII